MHVAGWIVPNAKDLLPRKRTMMTKEPLWQANGPHNTMQKFGLNRSIAMDAGRMEESFTFVNIRVKCANAA